MRESKLRQPVCALWTKQGALVIPVSQNRYGMSGTPDVFVSSLPFTGWVEFKGPETKREIDQEKIVFELRRRYTAAVFLRLGPRPRIEIPVERVTTDSEYTIGGRSAYRWQSIDTVVGTKLLECLAAACTFPDTDAHNPAI